MSSFCDVLCRQRLIEILACRGNIATNPAEELPYGQLGTTLLKPNLKWIKQRIDHAERGGVA